LKIKCFKVLPESC